MLLLTQPSMAMRTPLVSKVPLDMMAGDWGFFNTLCQRIISRLRSQNVQELAAAQGRKLWLIGLDGAGLQRRE